MRRRRRHRKPTDVRADAMRGREWRGSAIIVVAIGKSSSAGRLLRRTLRGDGGGDNNNTTTSRARRWRWRLQTARIIIRRRARTTDVGACRSTWRSPSTLPADGRHRRRRPARGFFFLHPARIIYDDEAAAVAGWKTDEIINPHTPPPPSV